MEVLPETDAEEAGPLSMENAFDILPPSLAAEGLSAPELGAPRFILPRQPAPARDACAVDESAVHESAVDESAVHTAPVWLHDDDDDVAIPVGPPEQPAVEAPHEMDFDDEGGAHSTFETPDAPHASQPPEVPSEPEVRSESEVEAPPPLVPSDRPVPSAGGHVVGVRILRRAIVWLSLCGFGVLCVMVLLSLASRPAGEVRSGAAPTAGGRPKTVATKRSPAQAPPASKAPAEVAPKSDEAAAPAEVHDAITQAEKADEVAAPPAQGQDEWAGKFTAQVGSYSNVSDANERVSALRAAGFEARAVAVEIPGRGVWHRVQCGRLGSREEAARFGALLRARGAARESIITEVQKQ